MAKLRAELFSSTKQTQRPAELLLKEEAILKR